MNRFIVLRQFYNMEISTTTQAKEKEEEARRLEAEAKKAQEEAGSP